MNEVTGIVLAGGVSRRLNYRDKALLKIGHVSVIEHVIEALSRATESVILITNSPDKFAHLDLPMFGDIIPRAGSLGGIYTGLKVSKTHRNLVMACDMPFIPPDLLKFLIDNSGGYDVTLPATPDGFQPICALYSSNCLEFIEAQIKEGDLKIINFYPHVKVNEVYLPALYPRYDPDTFFNINTNEDYQKALSMAKSYYK